MMKKTFTLLMASLMVSMGLSMPLCAQPNDTEPDDPKPADAAAWASWKKATLGWGSTDIRYSRSAPVAASAKAIKLNAWKGERVSAQAVLSTPVAFSSVKMSVSDLKCGKNIIPASAVSKFFVCYTICGAWQNNDPVLLPERLEEYESMAVDANTSRPLWIEVKVPASAAAGLYKATLTVDCDGQKLSLPFQLQVSGNVLPEPEEWSFHLDLWQNPYAAARYYQVPLWSKEHFDAMRPTMEAYAKAGAKVITASIIQHPWNGQTLDPFESMIAKMKQVDGSWKYDYSVFDKWIEFMLSCGITQQIDCYTLVPWHYKFDYYDCATNSVRYVECKPSEQAYRDMIFPFLKDFAAHLKAKGWFDITCIAMDERPMDQMNAAYALVKEADPGFRIAGAADYNVGSSEADKIQDMSVAYEFNLLTPETLARRHANGQFLTFYTCCGPEKPNTFTFSDLAESAFIGWHAAAVGYDGYLRWALCSWPEQPKQDTRFGPWSSGDTFLLYPGCSSLRFERLVEGIQDYEKIRIIRETGTEAQKAALEAVLAKCFAANKYDHSQAAADLVAEGKKVLLSVQGK